MVEYRTGAGGSLGAEMAARATPDGYTLFTGSNGPLTVNPFVQAKLAYDPLEGFRRDRALAQLAPHCIAVHESVPAKTLPELIALSKEQAGEHRHRRRRQRDAHDAGALHRGDRCEVRAVPYRGGGALVPDMLSGAITGAMTEISTALPHYNGGKVRIVAIASTERATQARTSRP